MKQGSSMVAQKQGWNVCPHHTRSKSIMCCFSIIGHNMQQLICDPHAYENKYRQTWKGLVLRVLIWPPKIMFPSQDLRSGSPSCLFTQSSSIPYDWWLLNLKSLLQEILIRASKTRLGAWKPPWTLTSNYWGVTGTMERTQELFVCSDALQETSDLMLNLFSLYFGFIRAGPAGKHNLPCVHTVLTVLQLDDNLFKISNDHWFWKDLWLVSLISWWLLAVQYDECIGRSLPTVRPALAPPRLPASTSGDDQSPGT